MNVTSVNSSNSAAAYLAQQASTSSDASSVTSDKSKSAKAGNDPATIKKAASQFEAIILRQLLAPAIDPIMSGGMACLTGRPGASQGYHGTEAPYAKASEKSLRKGRDIELRSHQRRAPTRMPRVAPATQQCALVPAKVRAELTTSSLQRCNFVRAIWIGLRSRPDAKPNG